MKSYLLRACLMVPACWFLSCFFVSSIYPPRTATGAEVFFLLIVGLSSALLANPHIPCRFSIYYSFFAALPVLMSITTKLCINLKLSIRAGSDPVLTEVYLPLGSLLLLLMMTSAIASFLSAHLKALESDKELSEDDPRVAS